MVFEVVKMYTEVARTLGEKGTVTRLCFPGDLSVTCVLLGYVRC